MTKTHVIVGSIRRLSVHVAFRPLKLPFIANKKRTFTINHSGLIYLQLLKSITTAMIKSLFHWHFLSSRHLHLIIHSFHK